MQFPVSSIKTLFCGLAAASLVMACSDDSDTDPNGTADAGPVTDTSTGGADTVGGDDTSGATCAAADPSHTELVYRVQRSPTFSGQEAVTILDPGGVGVILQGLINGDIETNRLHILISTREFASECGATTFEITGNAGSVTESGTYDWFPNSTVNYKPATIDADGNVVNLENLSLIFPAILPDSDDTLPIPAEDIEINGTILVGANGPEMIAKLVGAIYEDAIAELPPVAIGSGEPRPLASLLGESNRNIDRNGRLGWRLEADLVAVPVTPVDGFFEFETGAATEGSSDGSGN